MPTRCVCGAYSFDLLEGERHEPWTPSALQNGGALLALAHLLGVARVSGGRRVLPVYRTPRPCTRHAVGVRRGAVHRDVWLSTHHLSAVGLVAVALPGCGLVYARLRVSARDVVQLARHPQFGPFRLLSFAFIGGGFWLLARRGRCYMPRNRHMYLPPLGRTRIRHPQYHSSCSAFWCSGRLLLTLAMFSMLVVMYILLARREEREVESVFGDAYRRYAARTSAFVPHLGGGGTQ